MTKILENAQEAANTLGITASQAIKLEGLMYHALAVAFGDNKKIRNTALVLAHMKREITNQEFDELTTK